MLSYQTQPRLETDGRVIEAVKRLDRYTRPAARFFGTLTEVEKWLMADGSTIKISRGRAGRWVLEERQAPTPGP